MGRGNSRGMGAGRGMGRGGGKGMGRGMGRRRGRDQGMGWNEAGRSGAYPGEVPFNDVRPAEEPASPDRELALLKEQAGGVETQLKEINARIGRLKQDGGGAGVTAVVDPDKCTGCLRCSHVCPVGAISAAENAVDIDPSICTGCGLCIPECPEDALVLKNT